MKTLKLLFLILYPVRVVHNSISSPTIKLFIVLLLFSPFPSLSIPNFNKKLDEEFKNTIPILTSEMIEIGLSLPEFNSDAPFWYQIRNSEQLPDIEGFYKSSDPMIMDQIKEGYFYYKLDSIRNIEFLKAHFIDKFFRDHRTFIDDNDSDFFKFFIEHINEKDLNSIKDFMKKYRFSKTEKILTIIALIHTNRFGNQILDFIKNLSFDINQTVRNNGFIYKHFDFLKHNIVITSLAYELVATGDPNLIKKVGEDKSFNPNIRPPLGENLIHFFIRSNSNRISQSDQFSTPSIAISSLINQFSYFLNERDLIGYTPLMTAVQCDDLISIKEILSFASSPSSHLNLTDILRDRDYYGRSLIDIAFYNKNLELASHFMQITDSPLIGMTSNLYVIKPESNQLTATNKLPYMHISPIFSSYIENIQTMLEQNINYEIEPSNKKEIDELKNSLNILRKKSSEIDIWEQQRQTLISQLLKERSIFPIIPAIQKKSEQALVQLSEQEKQLLGLLTSLEEGQPVFHEMEFQKQNQLLTPQSREDLTPPKNTTILTHFLNEAIIYNSLPAVKYLLENVFDRKWFKFFIENDQTNVNFIIDPLSLALLAYASIPNEDEQVKKDAKQIIRVLSDYQNPAIYPNAKIYSSPMGWAITLGLLDEVQFFHEKKFVDIPEGFVIGINNVKMEMETLLATELHEFLFLRKYILENQDPEDTISYCEQIFMH